MDKAATQFDILKAELKLVQQQMDKYDQLSTTTKTWAITLWAASIGWAFQVKRPEIFLLSIIIVATFWSFDALNKTFRQGYNRRRKKVAEMLEYLFRTGEIAEGMVAPRLPEHRRREMINNMLYLHTAAPYLLLSFISIVLYWRY